MEGCWLPLLLLWLTAGVDTAVPRLNAEQDQDKLLVKNLSDGLLRAIPHSDSSTAPVAALVIEGSLIGLNEADRMALASYPALVELHLNGNLVTALPANYFSVVPHLRVLSLSRNNISSLDPDTFSGLDVLSELDLSHNLLTSLHTQLFRQLNNLQVLNLQENPWNCSCPLLHSIREAAAAGVTVGGPGVTCASPKQLAGRNLLEATAPAECDPSPAATGTTVQQKPAAGSSLQPSTAAASTYSHGINKVLKPVPVGNSWKFTACVAALALCTSTLIVCAIKGPSLYKHYHNYRHQRLHQEQDDTVSTVFSETGRYPNHQTFTFEQQNGQIQEDEVEEEEEDGYFEDPYIKSEEGCAGEGISANRSW